MKSKFFFAAAMIIAVAISHTENFEIKYVVRGDVCTLKAAASGFKVENLRSYGHM